MIIVGLDLSPTSPGMFKYELDENMNPTQCDFGGFTTVKKNEMENIHFYHKTKEFNNYLDREQMMLDKILSFCEGANYVAIEDYAFNAQGKVFHIAEFAGLVKYNLYKKQIPMRLYDPGTIKILASTRGNCDKISMFEGYEKWDWSMKFSLDGLPEVKKSNGNGPTSDIIDAFFCCNLLLIELTIREGIKSVKDYDERVIRIMNRVTKAHPVNLLDTDFLVDSNN